MDIRRMDKMTSRGMNKLMTGRKVELSDPELVAIIDALAPHRGDYRRCTQCHRTLGGAYVHERPHKRGCLALKMQKNLDMLRKANA